MSATYVAPYLPAFESQRDDAAPTPWTNCNPASCAMLIDQWTYGRINTTDVALRRASSVPLTQGMNFAQVGAAIAKLYPTLGTLRYSERDGSGSRGGADNRTWEELRDHLTRGYGAVVCGNYDSVARHRNAEGLLLTRHQPGGTFGHAVFVVDYNPATSKLRWYDPLANPASGYKGDVIDIWALWDFIWRTGNEPASRVTAAFSFTTARPPKPTVPPPGPSADQRIAAKNAAFDKAGLEVRDLEAYAATISHAEDFAPYIEAIRVPLRAGRKA
jgi:hypothetical protein